MAVIHYSIRVKGLVQGVGFRYATLREAGRRGVTGTVRNEDDGGVAIEAEGERAALNQFKKWCEGGPAGAVVQTFTCQEKPLVGFTSFEIEA
jgi:acylphosphatase